MTEQMTVQILRIITVYLDPERMEEVNLITCVDEFATDNWCDFSVFEESEQRLGKKLADYVEPEELQALKDGKADYIAFRLDQ